MARQPQGGTNRNDVMKRIVDGVIILGALVALIILVNIVLDAPNDEPLDEVGAFLAIIIPVIVTLGAAAFGIDASRKAGKDVKEASEEAGAAHQQAQQSEAKVKEAKQLAESIRSDFQSMASQRSQPESLRAAMQDLPQDTRTGIERLQDRIEANLQRIAQL